MVGFGSSKSGGGESQSAPSFVIAPTGLFNEDANNLIGQQIGSQTLDFLNFLQPALQGPLPPDNLDTNIGLPSQIPQNAAQLGGVQQLGEMATNPSFANTPAQKAMTIEMLNTLNAGSNIRGLRPSVEGVSRGMAPLFNQFRKDEIENLNNIISGGSAAQQNQVAQRGTDIGASLQFQDIKTASNIARSNLLLNSLLALADASKDTVVGGQKSTAVGPSSSSFDFSLFGSDRRLKINIVKIGQLANGLVLYLYNYIGMFEELYGPQSYIGVMSDEVRELIPEAVSVNAEGYDMVDYARII